MNPKNPENKESDRCYNHGINRTTDLQKYYVIYALKK